MLEVSRRVTLTSFVPRQVMLEKSAMEKKKDETVKVMEVEDKGKKSKKNKSSKISSKGKDREELLRSIAAFLEANGFVNTLSVFRSEARIKVNSGEGSCIDLEDLFNNIIESSKTDPVASKEWSKEQDVRTIDKKRKSKQISDSFGQEDSEKNRLDATLGTEENTDYGKPLEVEKKKKQKVVLGANMGNGACLNVEEVTKEKIENLKDLTRNSIVETGDFEKDKGEKKKKMEAKQFLEQSNQKVIAKKPKHQEAVNLDNLVKDLPENVDRSRKKNKKNKKLEKSTSDSLHTHNSDKIVEETSDRVGKHDNDGLQKSGFRKEGIAISNENTTDVETTTNKKRKRSSSKETSLQLENITAASISKQTKPEVAKEEKEACDQKVLTCTLNRESKKPSKALSSVVLDNHEENSTLQDPQNQLNGDQLANGVIKKHQKEGSTRPKSMKKENHSGEPKVVNAFQRVKVDEIQFADERLQDNSYWALDDSGSGYGAKAQEILGQVRGRDFRHEKTKKKRGAYRGGEINLQSHSIKFNYSEEE